MADKILNIIILFALAFICGCQAQSNESPIVFSRLTDDYWQIWTMQADGGKASQLTASEVDKRYPVWTENGKSVLFRTNNNQLFKYALKNGQEQQILKHLGLNSGVAQSPDGSRLILVQFTTQPREKTDLWITTTEGQVVQILTEDNNLQYDPAWSPDGNRIVYISKSGGCSFDLYSINSDGQNMRNLTENRALELLPAVSPDSKTIAYVSNITGDYEIWLMEADGGNNHRLTDYEGIDTRPCWSPDGKQIMFVSNRSGQLQIWIMNKDGTELRPLTSGMPSKEPDWRK